MFKVPEQHRVRAGYMRSTEEQGNNGVFKIVKGYHKEVQIICIASDSDGWENVSVAVKKKGRAIMPTIGQMNMVKDLFWDKQDCVVQFYPPEDHQLKNGKNILNLWRKEGQDWLMPLLEENDNI